MAYRIKIKNKMGTFTSGRKFKTKSSAEKVVKLNRESDMKTNAGGFRNLKGKLIKISNKYRIVKDK